MKVKFWVSSLVLSVAAISAIAQVSGSAQSSGSASASASAQAGGVSRASGMSSGVGAANGTINGEKVFVAEFNMKSSSANSTNEFRAKVVEHEAYVKNLAAKYNFVLAGQYVEDGVRMLAISTKDPAIAKQIVDNSPLVKSGFTLVKLRELTVSVAKFGGAPARHAAEAVPDSISTDPRGR